MTKRSERDIEGSPCIKEDNQSENPLEVLKT